MTARTAAALLMFAALATGCKQQASKEADTPLPVLTGAVSDAMLPVDRVTSQPPLDPSADRSAPVGATGSPERSNRAPAKGAAPGAAATAEAAPAPTPQGSQASE